ncbi:hypothetical protein, partial [uncultured Nostoc sp.]|uniref:hypothetical protein n=1 Tax=uncultured Nostoc sp. TaxID=340711 RepID=UPI0035CB6C56
AIFNFIFLIFNFEKRLDWQRNVILSCGLGGKIKSLDLATGESKVYIGTTRKTSDYPIRPIS